MSNYNSDSTRRLERELGELLLPQRRPRNPNFRRFIWDEAVLLERAISYLPKGIPAEAIHYVECDPCDGEFGGPSYWVCLREGYICADMGCHTIHEDTLKQLRQVMKSIYREED